MTRLPLRHPARSLSLFAAVLLTLALPMAVMADAELATSDPAEGATVEAPFASPIVLTFSEDLVGESGAEVHDSAGKIVATSDVDGAIVTVTPEAALSEGEYEVRWTSIADDGHIKRGTIRFTIVAAAGPESTPTPTPTHKPTEAGSTAPSSAPATATPDPAGGTDTSGNTSSGGDVILPIIVGALLVGALAVFVLRRRDSTSNPS